MVWSIEKFKTYCKYSVITSQKGFNMNNRKYKSMLHIKYDTDVDAYFRHEQSQLGNELT